jgi:GNAT superfamily N-acetyltransferase
VIAVKSFYYTIPCTCYRFAVEEGNAEIGRASLVVIKNDLHEAPLGLMEDVHVDPSHRGQGIGKQLVATVIAKARELGCYKLIATSRHERPRVHALYKELGFVEHGLEFRMDFNSEGQ